METSFTDNEYEHDVQTVRDMMGESAEEQLADKISWLVREMDGLCALANNRETRDLIEKEALGVGQIRFRANLILSFLDAGDPPPLMRR